MTSRRWCISPLRRYRPFRLRSALARRWLYGRARLRCYWQEVCLLPGPELQAAIVSTSLSWGRPRSRCPVSVSRRRRAERFFSRWRLRLGCPLFYYYYYYYCRRRRRRRRPPFTWQGQREKQYMYQRQRVEQSFSSNLVTVLHLEVSPIGLSGAYFQAGHMCSLWTLSLGRVVHLSRCYAPSSRPSS